MECQKWPLCKWTVHSILFMQCHPQRTLFPGKVTFQNITAHSVFLFVQFFCQFIHEKNGLEFCSSQPIVNSHESNFTCTHEYSSHNMEFSTQLVMVCFLNNSQWDWSISGIEIMSYTLLQNWSGERRFICAYVWSMVFALHMFDQWYYRTVWFPCSLSTR